MTLSEAIEAKTGVCLSLSSFCIFFTYSMIMENYIKMPQTVVVQNSSAQFINMVISCTHASISACWSLYCFYTDDDVVSDMINHSTVSTYLLCCFSGGYFLHDALHYIRHIKLSKCWEILLHHTVVSACFGTAILSHRYVNFSTMALLVEINSVFLHIRKILILIGYSKNSDIYKVNGILNILSYIFFRICVIGWMCRWSIINFHITEQPYNTIGTVGLVVMTVINIILFGRILVKDNWIKLHTVFPSTSFNKPSEHKM